MEPSLSQLDVDFAAIMIHVLLLLYAGVVQMMQTFLDAACVIHLLLCSSWRCASPVVMVSLQP